MNTYHIEYIVHLEIEAESEDEALKLGSQELHALDGDGLANCCEFLDIEIALTGDYCDHEYEAYCPNCGIDAPDDDQDGTGILYDEDGNSEYEKAMGAPYDDTDTTQTTKEV